MDREIHVAIIQHKDGTTLNLGAFFKDDEKAFGEIMDEMQILCQKDDNICQFGIEILPTIGDLQTDIVLANRARSK